MTKKIFLGALLAVILITLLVWILTGGLSNVKAAFSQVRNPLTFFSGLASTTFGGGIFHAPWDVPLPQVGDGSVSTPPDNSGSNVQDQSTSAGTTQTITSGTLSPYRTIITMREAGATAQDPDMQYIEIDAASANTTAVDISGWSLFSAVSGERIYIPQAAQPFIMGRINNVSPVLLEPGAIAIVTSGTSPVGVSFHENMCTGYLQQVASFTPNLSSSCPSPSDIMPETADNLKKYGDACFNYVQNLPACTFPDSSMTTNLSSECRTFITTNLSYNGCVGTNQTSPSFYVNSWRLYINSRLPLWRSQHDIIRLLDGDGKTVDAITY